MPNGKEIVFRSKFKSSNQNYTVRIYVQLGAKFSLTESENYLKFPEPTHIYSSND